MIKTQEVKFNPIGVVHTPSKMGGRQTRQSKFSNIKGKIEIYNEYAEGLKDLELFEYIICITYFHLVKPPISLLSTTPWDNDLHGIFAIRSPLRPNPIGFSILKLEKIEKNSLFVDNLDIADGTPVLDLKPFIPDIDNRETEKVGWIKDKL